MWQAQNPAYSHTVLFYDDYMRHVSDVYNE